MSNFNKMSKMKGVRFVTNDRNKLIAVQIDLKLLERRRSEIESLLDIIIAESRKDDEDVNWKDAKRELKKAYKIDFVDTVLKSGKQIKRGKSVKVSSKEFDQLLK